MRHIIIEGPDGAGKTTLARQLCDQFGLAYHHEGPPPATDVLGHYARLFVNAPVPTLFDRFHLGELVYGPLLRSASALSLRDVRLLTRLIVGSGSLVFICLPSYEVCHANTRGRQEFITDTATLIAAHAAWCALSYTAYLDKINTFIHDYTRNTITNLRFLPALPDGVIGSPAASVLLVGEQANGALDLPFFGPAHSSLFLHDAITAADIPERELALTNILDVEGHERDIADMAARMPMLTTIVALGLVARTRLATLTFSAHVAVRHVPHPQYWKRFKSSQPGEYARLLKEAARVA